jgi:hypothetical protein
MHAMTDVASDASETSQLMITEISSDGDDVLCFPSDVFFLIIDSTILKTQHIPPDISLKKLHGHCLML